MLKKCNKKGCLISLNNLKRKTLATDKPMANLPVSVFHILET